MGREKWEKVKMVKKKWRLGFLKEERSKRSATINENYKMLATINAWHFGYPSTSGEGKRIGNALETYWRSLGTYCKGLEWETYWCTVVEVTFLGGKLRDATVITILFYLHCLLVQNIALLLQLLVFNLKWMKSRMWNSVTEY